MFNFFKKKNKKIAENEGSKALSDVQNDKEVQHNEKNLKEIVSNTSKSLIENVFSLIKNDEVLDEFTLEDIENQLIKADLGVDFAQETIEKLKNKKITKNNFKEFLKNEFQEILNSAGDTKINFKENSINIYMVVGVNGAGKTTLIGKFAKKLKENNLKVLIAAGDTFRAAAEAQLDVWAKRAGVDIVRRDGADSASVVYEAIERAKNENYDVILIDTAGRLQNKFNLIEELKKIKGVIDKNAPDSIAETILVLDANLGQNGLSQAKVFAQAVDVSSIAMTKLDGSAKGGLILAVAKDYKLPTKLIATGENIDDLREFSSEEFLEALF